MCGRLARLAGDSLLEVAAELSSDIVGEEAFVKQTISVCSSVRLTHSTSEQTSQ